MIIYDGKTKEVKYDTNNEQGYEFCDALRVDDGEGEVVISLEKYSLGTEGGEGIRFSRKETSAILKLYSRLLRETGLIKTYRDVESLDAEEEA